MYDQGDLVRAEGVFTNAAGTAIDPTAVKVTVRRPGGQVATYVYGTDAAVVKDSTGNYHIDIDAHSPGTWYYRWWSTGTGQAAGERAFQVAPAKAVL